MSTRAEDFRYEQERAKPKPKKIVVAPRRPARKAPAPAPNMSGSPGRFGRRAAARLAKRAPKRA